MTTFCVVSHVTHLSCFFPAGGLSNLHSEMQRAQVWSISIPKEPDYSKVYIYPPRVQAGRLPGCTCMVAIGAPLRVYDIYSSRSLSQLLICISKGSEPQNALHWGLGCACSASISGHLSLNQFGPRPKWHPSTLLTSAPGKTQTIFQDK